MLHFITGEKKKNRNAPLLSIFFISADMSLEKNKINKNTKNKNILHKITSAKSFVITNLI